MMIPNRLLIFLAVFGFAVAWVLWIFSVVPWWALPLVIIAAPVVSGVILIILFYALWIASGSH